MKTEIFQCQCRTRFDLIICYNIMFGFVCVNADDFFEFRVSNTRGHSYKLYQQFSIIVHLDQSFSQKPLSHYGIVSLEIVLISAPSININPH